MVIGNVEILPDLRCVLVSSKPFNLGSRAYDILELLAKARGRVVGTDEIMHRVWPNSVVCVNNLYVHICAIRKMLGCGANLLVAVPGRGYRLVVDASDTRDCAFEKTIPGPRAIASNLPVAGSLLYGRESAVEDVIRASGRESVVSLVGAGGIGKTRLAIEVGRRLIDDFADGVWLVELHTANEPKFVARAVANVLNPCATQSDLPLEAVTNFLRHRQALLILDNCEHVVQAAAELVESVLKRSPACRVLATSRQPLKVTGEFVYLVPSLEVPTHDERDGEAERKSAVQLFLSQVRRIDRLFAADTQNVFLAGKICRRIDGLPLAIELAAVRAATVGIEELAANLDDHFTILSGGCRTAPPHHQSLSATFDWSYGLLPEKQQLVIRRLAIFPAAFDLESAVAIASDDQLNMTDIVEAVSALFEKSLLISQSENCSPQYRLLQTNRAYASQKLTESDERKQIEYRFVRHVFTRLQHTITNADADNGRATFEDFRLQLDDVGAALQLTFSSGGDTSLGIEIIALAAPMLSRMGLWLGLSRHTVSALNAPGNGHQSDRKAAVRVKR